MSASGRAPLDILLATPRGFCAGVVRAVDVVERALDLYGPPVYIRHAIVHNTHVVESLRARGAVFVEDTDEIPRDAIAVFSAHGVSRAVERAAAARGLDVIDATCPLVRKVHHEGQRHAAQGHDVILIGRAGHPEVEGTRGQIDGTLHVVAMAADVAGLCVRDATSVAYITQTTLGVEDTRAVIAALKARFPWIVGPDTRDICYATQNRQNAVAEPARQVELVLVVGSANSSNSNRLREIASAAGATARLVDGPADIDPAWLAGVASVGITAGASAPEYLVQGAISRLSDWREARVRSLDGHSEAIAFRLPARLAPERAAQAAAS